MAVLLAVIGGGAAFFVLGDDGESERVTELATIRGDAVEFEPVELADDVVVERQWTITDDELTSTATITNDTDAKRWVIYDEVIPRPFRGEVALGRIDAGDIEGAADTDHDAVRFATELRAGASFAVTYDTDLETEPTFDELEAWTEAMDDAFAEHLADDERSPRDRDVDGVADAVDRCPNEAGTLDGCPDRDDDGFPDDEDECPADAGDLDGCPDRDGDGVRDGDDACPNQAGRLDGCPDADGDGFADAEDECPDDAGDVLGCPDLDGDGVIDAEDRCPLAPGDVDGCPDTDGDGFADPDDQCPDEPGEIDGCQDDDGDGTIDADDACPGVPGDFQGCPDNPAFYGRMYTVAVAQSIEFERIVVAYDPDGDGLTENFANYCGEVRTNEQVSADNLQGAIDEFRSQLSPETLAIADRTLVNVRNNVTLVASCAGGASRGPWEINGSGWTTICALWNPLITRSGEDPIDC